MSEEKVVRLGADGFSVTILPDVGGKIASIRVDGRELLQAPLNDSMVRSQAMSFDVSDASGWDECMPSVAACELRTAEGTVAIPDHGDLWRVAWDVVEASPSACTMRGRCFSLPLELTRTVKVERSGAGFGIHVDYSLRNTGGDTAPWAWSAHPLFAAEQGDRILLPESIQSVRVEYSRGERLGRRGAVVGWPIAESSGGVRDLSVVEAPESRLAEKLFAGPLAAEQNWCVLERRSAGVRIRVSFDPLETPFLGLWLCYGGWPEGAERKQMCVALEPTTAGADSLACAGTWQRELRPGASYAWRMRVEFERM